eukprot:1473262-Rhodomonas_salina.1
MIVGKATSYNESTRRSSIYPVRIARSRLPMHRMLGGWSQEARKERRCASCVPARPYVPKPKDAISNA